MFQEFEQGDVSLNDEKLASGDESGGPERSATACMAMTERTKGARRSKRRKLSSSANQGESGAFDDPIALSSPPDQQASNLSPTQPQSPPSSPEMVRTPNTATRFRFVLNGATQGPPHESQSHPLAPSRPTFVLSPGTSRSTEQAQPLPEVFSPHRRGEKFIPGGMAATAREWIVDLGQSVLQHRGCSRRPGTIRSAQLLRTWA